jgi:hypothetical protein
MGLTTLVFDGDLGAPANDHIFSDIFVAISCYDTWSVCDYLRRDAPPELQGVVGGGTDTPDVAAGIGALMGWPQRIKSRTAEISKNKWMQKKLFSQAGIRVPRWIAGSDDIRKTVPWGDVTLVVKPVSNRGSRGITRVEEGEDERDAVAYAARFDPRGHTIIEEWIDGVQLSSESLVQDGNIIYTAFSQRNYDRLEETYPYVIEDGGDMPPAIPLVYENDYQYEAEKALQECVHTMGLRSGTLKGDLVWDGRDIWIIEVACRLSGGSFCSTQIPEVWGIDFVGLAVRLALGEHIYPGEIRPYFRKYMCQRFVIPDKIKMHPERGPGFICYGQTREAAQFKAKEAVENYLDFGEKNYVMASKGRNN